MNIAVPALKNKTTIDPATWPNDGYSMELITGEAVMALFFNDAAFQKSWDLLFESCPWATVFQGRPFITAWYQVYGDQHLPILIKAVEKGQLKGVLPMVLLNTTANDPHLTSKGGRITGAGHYDAEYQTWLAESSDGDAFIKKALAELMKQFPGQAITFRFLPPGTPLDWLKEDTKWRQCSIVQSYIRPLINFKEPEVAKIFQRNHFRNKLNRLKRLGEVHFEYIRDLESFERSLHDMAVLYDFRQSALFNKKPFHEDPVKKDFLLELFRLQLLHVTVLKVNGKTMAAVAAVAGKDGWMHLAAINCHSPFNARFYSPGFLHFILLAKQLAEERIHHFDLSPGYDAYKDELANQHDEVKELVISPSLKFRIKRKIKKWIHTRLIAGGIRPMTAELTLKKYAYQVRHRSALSVIKQLVKRLQKKRKQHLYLIETYALQPGVKISLHKDNLKDLLHIESGKRAGVTRWEFLEDAMYRLERGQHCFTWIETGRLLCCAWFSYADTLPEKMNNNNPAPEHANVLQSLYCHAAAKDRLPSFLNGVIDELVNKERKSYFLADDLLFCRVLELAGSRIE